MNGIPRATQTDRTWLTKATSTINAVPERSCGTSVGVSDQFVLYHDSTAIFMFFVTLLQ